MLKFLSAAATLALIALPAAAQTTTPGTQNSGTGVMGQPGGKNGPPATKKMQPNTMSSSQTGQNQAVRNQDASKVPGKAGGKSGPAVVPPKSQ